MAQTGRVNLHPTLIRASAKVQQQLGCVPLKREVPPPFPWTWNVDVLEYGQKQHLVIASEECTLYSLLLPVSPALPASAFLIMLRDRLAQLFRETSWQQQAIAAETVFSNRTNRRVIGSQNDLLYLASQALSDAATPVSSDQIQSIETFLNATPMSYLGMKCPKNVFAQHWEKLKLTR